MSLWRRLVREAHRRSLWQVLGVYTLGAWIGYQVVLGLFEGLGLPDWVPPLAVVLFVIGLPVVLATAMVQEGPPRLDTFSLRSADPTLLPGLADVPADQADASAVKRHLTWSRSLIAGVAAFTLLAISATGFVVVRNRGTLLAQGAFDASDVVLIADFATRSAPADVGAVVTEALRIDLQQSDVLRLAEPALVAGTLERMRRSSADLPVDVAREVAVREGWKAVLAGEIGLIGGSYVLTAQLVTPDSARALASFRATAADSTALLGAVDDLSKQIRMRIGESLRSVRAAPPLERVSTRSLAALRKYVEASRLIDRTGDQLRAIELFEEAVALDSTFAMAWRRIGVALQNLNTRVPDRNRALTRAWELRDRLSEVEALLATATYERWVRANSDAAIAAYRRVLEIDPANGTALNNLAGVYLALERNAEAAELLRRGIDTGDVSEFMFTNLVVALFRGGDIAGAHDAVERGRAALPENLGIVRAEVRLAAATLDWQRADSLSGARLERAAGNPTARLTSLADGYGVALLQGRVTDALRLGTELERSLARNPEWRPQARGVALWLVDARLTLLGDSAAALRALNDAYVRYAPESFDSVIQAGHVPFALYYARAGQHDRADDILREGVERAAREGAAFNGEERARAVLALLRGDAQPALATLDRVSQAGVCRICDLPLLGRAFDLAGHADSARIAFDDFLTLPEWNRLQLDPWERPALLLRSAELHEAAGSIDAAIARYAELLELWERADPALHPRVEAAKAAIVRLRGPG